MTQENLDKIEQEAEELYPVMLMSVIGDDLGDNQFVDFNKEKREIWKAGRLKSDEEKEKEREALKGERDAFEYNANQYNEQIIELQKEIAELKEQHKNWKEECERLAGVADFWQKKYNEVVPPHQNPKIDNL